MADKAAGAGRLSVVWEVCGRGRGPVSSMAVGSGRESEDGWRWVAVTSRGVVVEVWEVAWSHRRGWAATHTGRGLHGDVVADVAMSRSGDVGFSVSRDGQVATWHLGHGGEQRGAWWAGDTRGAAGAGREAGGPEAGAAQERPGDPAEQEAAGRRQAAGPVGGGAVGQDEHGPGAGKAWPWQQPARLSEAGRAWAGDEGQGSVVGLVSSWHGLYVGVARRRAIGGFCGPGSRCSFRLPGGLQTVVAVLPAPGCPYAPRRCAATPASAALPDADAAAALLRRAVLDLCCQGGGGGGGGGGATAGVWRVGPLCPRLSRRLVENETRKEQPMLFRRLPYALS